MTRDRKLTTKKKKLGKNAQTEENKILKIWILGFSRGSGEIRV